jgi:hypothetical protein
VSQTQRVVEGMPRAVYLTPRADRIRRGGFYDSSNHGLRIAGAPRSLAQNPGRGLFVWMNILPSRIIRHFVA